MKELEQFYKTKHPKIKETDLAAKVVSWLQDQHWEVYQEVQFRRQGGVADIVAVRHNIMWIIESKTSYGFAVLEQATRWMVHYRSVAVPFHRRQDRDYRVAELYYRVGVIGVSDWGDVSEIVAPPLMYRDNNFVKDYLCELTELHKTYAKAGSQSGNHLTPYKQTMMEVRKVIEQNPGCTLKFLHDTLGNMHYWSKQSFMGSLIKALEDFEPWCKIDKSTKPYKLYITPLPND